MKIRITYLAKHRLQNKDHLPFNHNIDADDIPNEWTDEEIIERLVKPWNHSIHSEIKIERL
jgi:tRNA G18 (ribose-2'-O)-methylase SpoU